MAQRIFHQISSNVIKSPLLKGPIYLRSSSPQNDSAVTRNLGFTGRFSVLAQPNKSQQLSKSMPVLLQTSSNPNDRKIGKRFKHVEEDDQNKDIEEGAQGKFVPTEIQGEATEVDDMYLNRFQELLEDSNYPNQTAKEFPLNKRIQSVSAKSPVLKLNQDIVDVIKSRSEYRRPNRRLDFEEIEYQADVEYQAALRNMNIVGQKIDTDQYKIDINPTLKYVGKRTNLKDWEMDFYQHINKSLQPSNIVHFGDSNSSKQLERFKASKIFTKSIIEPVEIQEEDEAEQMETKRNTAKQITDYKEYDSLGQRKGSDEFIEQMKMLEPNYEPQKRYNTPNRKVKIARSRINKIFSNTKINDSHAELRSCENIINQLKNLNPDYVSSSIQRNKLSEAALVQSTINLINDYRDAVLNSRIDILNDTLYHTIKARHPEKHIQKSFPMKKVSTSTRVKVTVGSKLDLQQRSAATSPNCPPQYLKSKTNEKVLVPWPSLSETKKRSKTVKISALKGPGERKMSKHTMSNKPQEVFLPMTRSFSTKARIELKISEEQTVKRKACSTVKDNESALNLPPKFEFRNNEPWLPMRQRNTTFVKESKPTSKTKIIKNVNIQRMQSNPKIKEQSVASVKPTKSQLRTNELNNSHKGRDYLKKIGHSFNLETNDRNLPKYRLQNIPEIKETCVSKHQEENYVHKVGDNLNNAKIKLASHIPVRVKLDKTQKSQEEPRKSIIVEPKQVVYKTNRNINSAASEKSLQIKNSSTQEITKVIRNNAPFKSFSNTIQKQIHDKPGTVKNNLSKNTGPNKTSQQKTIPIIGSLKLPKKISAVTNLNTSSGIQLKKMNSNTTNIKAHDTNTKINAGAFKSTKTNIDNKVLPLKRVSKTPDSFLSSEENESKMKLRKSSELPLRKTSALDNPLVKLKVNTMLDMSNEKTQDLTKNLRDGEKSDNTVSKEYISERPDSALSPQYSCRSGESLTLANESQTYSLKTKHKVQRGVNNNNIGKRNFSMNSMGLFTMDLTLLKNNFAPFVRAYANVIYRPPLSYVKNVRLKRLKKRPGFDEDFPPTSNWKLLKHCKTICDQMQNPKMDKIMRYEEKSSRKKLPVMKLSNCPRFVKTAKSFEKLKPLKGPSMRPGYVHDDYKKCKISLCEETKPNRADNAARYVVKKKTLPLLMSAVPRATSTNLGYIPLLSYTKKIPIKRLEKRAGFHDDFPPTSNWKLLKHCKTICEQMQNPKMDKLLNYEERSRYKKLPVMKLSNCPQVVETEKSFEKLKPLKGPSMRPGYFHDDFKKCKITLCEETKPYRADNAARYVVRKKKLPLLLPRTSKLSKSSDNRILKKCPSINITCDKSIHTSASVLKHGQIRSRESVNITNKSTKKNEQRDESSKSKDSIQSINSANVKCNPRCISPYLSYSEYKVSKPQSALPLFESEMTPGYLQPNCPIIGPPFALGSPPPVTADMRREENFTKIPNPRIQELNKFAKATAFASRQKIIPKEKEVCPRRERTFESPKELLRRNAKEEFQPELQSSGIESKCKDSETDLFTDTCENCYLKNKAPTSCVKAIISTHEEMDRKYFMQEGPSFWDRMSNYFKTKLDIALNVQDEKPQPEAQQNLFLCSGSECKNSRPKLGPDNSTKQFESQSYRCDHCPRECHNKNCNCVEEPPPMKQCKTTDQKFSKEYDTLVQKLNERRNECGTSSIDNLGSGTSLLKSNIERSQEILTRKNFSTFSVHSRAYSSRSPKTPLDLLEYFSRIQNEKTSNIDEDELANNILTAIKVGMELIKKSKSTNITDTYFDLFKQLDAVSKSELQSLNLNEGDVHVPQLWPPGTRKTNLQDQENRHVVNTIQQFCQNVCDIQNNCSVFDYEESERKKTRDLQRVLDDMLKHNADT